MAAPFNFGQFRLCLAPLLFLFFMPSAVAQVPGSSDSMLTRVEGFFKWEDNEKKAPVSLAAEQQKDALSSLKGDAVNVREAVATSLSKAFSYVGELFDKAAPGQEAEIEEAVPAAFSQAPRPSADIFISCPDLELDDLEKVPSGLEKRSSNSIVKRKRLKKIVVNSLVPLNGNRYSLYDANPLFFPGNEQRGSGIYAKLSGPEKISDLQFVDLLKLKTRRDGVAADGVSQLLFIVRSTEAGRYSSAFELDNESGKIQFINAGATCSYDGVHMAVGIYTAPQLFGRGSGMRKPTQRSGAFAESKFLKLPLIFRPSGVAGSVYQSKELALKIVRPPIVLVHGTFDNGGSAWLSPASFQGHALSNSFASTLKQSGFLPFIVDYRGSNGSAGSSKSGFYDNRYIVWNGGGDSTWLNTKKATLRDPDAPATGFMGVDQQAYTLRGGIKQALSHYRDNLNIAVARADLVGHSMGGLLARVNAAPKYNDNYRRPDNYGAGDINRLITISTPHHGSELPQMLQFLSAPTRSDESTESAIYRTAFTKGAWFKGVKANRQALKDQIPGSDALRRIGETQVPSHLFVTVTRAGGLKNKAYDPTEAVFYRGSWLAYLFAAYPENLRDYLAEIKAGWISSGLPDEYFEQLAAEFSYLINQENAHLKWVKDNFGDGWMDKRVADAQYGVSDTTIEAIRRLTFRFDDNDSTVRVDSQRGSLPLASDFVTLFQNTSTANEQQSVMHGVAPRYQKLQLNIVDTLKSGADKFVSYLPAAGQIQAPYPSDALALTPVRINATHAIAWSGMDFRHAWAFLDVAVAEDVIIMGRPVNPDATILIINNAATKGMNVKGKSSNWGPQKGYLARNQRYSKIWRNVKDPANRNAQIEKFNIKTESMLKAEELQYQVAGSGKPIAVAKQLIHQWPRCYDKADSHCLAQQQAFSVWVMPDKVEADAEQAIYLCQGTPAVSAPCSCTAWFDWRTSKQLDGGSGFDFNTPPSQGVTPAACDKLLPMEVIADNSHPDTPYMTADYDFLTTGFYCPQGKASPSAHCQAWVKVADTKLPKAESCSGSLKHIQATYSTGRPPTPLPCFDPQTGLITEAQKDLLVKINKAVISTGYTGGKVSHHGPETQFFESPYVDYPITVFDPRGENGQPEILSIQKGPEGFRDINLKRYYEKKIKQGFWLYPNEDQQANWHWRRRFSSAGQWLGYHYEDDPALARNDDVEQMPSPPCVTTEIKRQLDLRRGLPVAKVETCRQVATETER